MTILEGKVTEIKHPYFLTDFWQLDAAGFMEERKSLSVSTGAN
jgi:hypothetical protein